MARRCVYYVDNNTLCMLSFEATWSDADTKTNRVMSEIDLMNNLPAELRPCLEVSLPCSLYRVKSFSPSSIMIGDGSVLDAWKQLDNCLDKDKLPDGAKELLYLRNIDEYQLNLVLSSRSFYDMYHNPDKNNTTIAKALCGMQMLYNQNKLDYLEDKDKFVHWYYINCLYPKETSKYKEYSNVY